MYNRDSDFFEYEPTNIFSDVPNEEIFIVQNPDGFFFYEYIKHNDLSLKLFNEGRGEVIKPNFNGTRCELKVQLQLQYPNAVIEEYESFSDWVNDAESACYK